MRKTALVGLAAVLFGSAVSALPQDLKKRGGTLCPPGSKWGTHANDQDCPCNDGNARLVQFPVSLISVYWGYCYCKDGYYPYGAVTEGEGTNCQRCPNAGKPGDRPGYNCDCEAGSGKIWIDSANAKGCFCDVSKGLKYTPNEDGDCVCKKKDLVWNEVANACTCPPDYFRATSTAACKACPQGTTNDGSKPECQCTDPDMKWNQKTNQCECRTDQMLLKNGKCEKCPDHSKPNKDTKKCECDRDFVMNAAGTTCTSCGSGEEVDPKTKTCICRSERVKNTATKKCEDCPRDAKYNPNTKACDCPNNLVLDWAARKCGCTGETVLNAFGSCASCPDGTYFSQNTKACACPNNQVLDKATGKCGCPSDKPALNGSGICVACSNTQVFNRNTKTCDAVAPAQCPSGQTRDSASGNCVCASETVKNAAGKCEACPKDTKFNTTTKSCDAVAPAKCPSGQTRNAASGNCVCDGETVMNATGACEACPKDTKFNTTTKSCDVVAPPKCPSGQTRDGASGNCVCVGETVMNAAGACEACPKDTKFNTTTKSCDVVAPPKCPSGQTRDGASGNCICVGETVMNAAGACEACPSNCTFNKDTKTCDVNQPEPTKCPNNQVLDESTGKCCCTGETVLTVAGMCESCAPGTKFNQDTKACEQDNSANTDYGNTDYGSDESDSAGNGNDDQYNGDGNNDNNDPSYGDNSNNDPSYGDNEPVQSYGDNSNNDPSYGDNKPVQSYSDNKPVQSYSDNKPAQSSYEPKPTTCPNNQVMVKGQCGCEGSTPVLNAKGCCEACPKGTKWCADTRDCRKR